MASPRDRTANRSSPGLKNLESESMGEVLQLADLSSFFVNRWRIAPRRW
jgi:hypothetical protein